MSRSSLQGTPWHSEYLKSSDDTRRHKTRCIYYKKGKCLKKLINCFGSAHCGSYREIKNVETKIRVLNETISSPKKVAPRYKKIHYDRLVKTTKNRYSGSIDIKIEGGQIKRYNTSNTPDSAMIFDKVYIHKQGDTFKMGDISIYVVKNKLVKIDK